MHLHRRRKKRPNYGVRTVEIDRGANGFGFTISGQQPCILSCIVTNSPADQAGLRAGDFLISVNGLSVSKVTHDSVVKLIANSVGPIKMSIAEYYYSDSSDEETVQNCVAKSRPRYPYRPKICKSSRNDNSSISTATSSAIKQVSKLKAGCISKKVLRDMNSEPSEKEREQDRSTESHRTINYRAVIGYLGTIEMPDQLAPSNRMHTICSCVRKFRQEKRQPSTVAMTVQSSCISLMSVNEQLLAVYPACRLVYIGGASDKQSCYFGLITTAVNNNDTDCDVKYPKRRQNDVWNSVHSFGNENSCANKYPDIPFASNINRFSGEICSTSSVSNSCHVFMTDPKILSHAAHAQKANTFNITCTRDIVTGACLEFPKNCEYIVNLVQNMYGLPQSSVKPQNDVNRTKVCEVFVNPIDQVIANSPQPSASSNSDSGIGFKDEYIMASDRILVVDFPAQPPLPLMGPPGRRPSAIDGSTLSLKGLERPPLNLQQTFSKESPNKSPDAESNVYEEECSGQQSFDRNSKLVNFYCKNHITEDECSVNNIRACIDKSPKKVFPEQKYVKNNIGEETGKKSNEDGTKFNNYCEEHCLPNSFNRMFENSQSDTVVNEDSDNKRNNVQTEGFGSETYSIKPVSPGKSGNSRLTVRVMPDPIGLPSTCPSSLRSESLFSQCTDNEMDYYSERPVDIPDEIVICYHKLKSPDDQFYDNSSLNNPDSTLNSNECFKSYDNDGKHKCDKPNEYLKKYENGESNGLSQNSRKASMSTSDKFVKSVRDTFSVFKTPASYDNKIFKLNKKAKKNEDNDNNDPLLSYKLSPKVYGLQKPNLSCEELSTECKRESQRVMYGSLQDLCSFEANERQLTAVSEPDVRFRRESETDSYFVTTSNGSLPVHEPIEASEKIDAGPSNWAATFEKLLEDVRGYEAFVEFLKKEFSVENIHFWISCERYRKLESRADRIREAQLIYENHLCPGAPEPVNVDSQARHFTQEALKQAETTLFLQAQKQIFNLMKFDSYPRFLKSDLYKNCLDTNNSKPNGQDQNLDIRLQSVKNTPNKLKKSLSNAEDRRRKSLLPWHRKNRSKSRDRGESGYAATEDGQLVSCDQDVENASQISKDRDIYSSKSSLTSWDIAANFGQDEAKLTGSETSSTGSCGLNKNQLCRVILCDGATTVAQIRSNETVRELAKRLLDKRGLRYSNFEVYITSETKPIDLNETSAHLACREVVIEQRVVFRLDLPNRKVISVKSKPTKTLADVLKPILHKYGYKLELVQVLESAQSDKRLDVNVAVTEVDGYRLSIVLGPVEGSGVQESVPLQKLKLTAGPSLDEITNRVFEELLQGKAQSNSIGTISDRGSVKSEDWGSEHSSGVFSRFLRKDSGNAHDKKNKKFVTGGRSKNSSVHGSGEDIASDSSTKKPLIAKWKAGVKLHVASKSSESDELYEGLKRAQRSRLEDQRGTEINFELPDFLKDKENAQQRQQSAKKFRKQNDCRQDGLVSELTAKFYDIGSANKLSVRSQNHDRLAVNAMNPISFAGNNNVIDNSAIKDVLSTNVSPLKLPMHSPTKSLGSDEQSPSKSSTSSNLSRTYGSLEMTVIENIDQTLMNSAVKEIHVDTSEPPPLPPKPKVLPIKPSNWKKNIPVNAPSPNLYLDQPNSSLV